MVVRVTAPETQVKKVATDGTTIVKKIVVGTPVRSVVGGLSISSLADVAINSLQNKQILVYNSTTQKFENSSEGLSIDGLGDTQITNLTNNQILIYDSDSGKFVNSSSLSPTGVTAGTYGTATKIPQLSVTAAGLLDSVGEINVATTINTAGQTGTGSVNLLDSSFTIGAGTGINTAASGNAITISLDSSATQVGTTADTGTGTLSLLDSSIAVIGGSGVSTSVSGNTFTIGLADSAKSFATAADTGTGSVNILDSSFTITGGTGINTTASGTGVTIDFDASATAFGTTGDTGTGTVNLLDSSLEVLGGTGISTVVTGNTVTVNLDSAINSGTFGNLSLSGNTLASTVGGEIVIDPNPVGAAGTVIIQGDLDVRGTQTTLSSTVLSITDKNIVLADSATTHEQADSAGMIIKGAGVNFIYNAASNEMKLNKRFDINLGLDSAGVPRVAGLEDSIGNSFLFNGQSFLNQITTIDGGVF